MRQQQVGCVSRTRGDRACSVEERVSIRMLCTIGRRVCVGGIFAVGPHQHQHGELPRLIRTVDIDAQLETVGHGDRRVMIEYHAWNPLSARSPKLEGVIAEFEPITKAATANTRRRLIILLLMGIK